MTLMTAAVVRDPARGFELERVRLDAPRAEEVLVRLVATGICHTDLGVARGTTSPRVLGHEGAGIVERVGDAVAGVKAGDKVILSFASCGECDKCLGGAPAHCRHFFPLNMAGARHDGSLTLNGEQGEPIAGSFFGQSSFAQYALTSPRNLVRVPDDTPEELLRILGPLGLRHPNRGRGRAEQPARAGRQFNGHPGRRRRGPERVVGRPRGRVRHDRRGRPEPGPARPGSGTGGHRHRQRRRRRCPGPAPGGDRRRRGLLRRDQRGRGGRAYGRRRPRRGRGGRTGRTGTPGRRDRAGPRHARLRPLGQGHRGGRLRAADA